MSGEKKGDLKGKSGASEGKSELPDGYIDIQEVMDKHEYSYKQVYRLINNKLVRYEKVKQSNTRPKFYVCEEDVIAYINRNKVHAEDYERLRAEKLAVEIRLKRLKEEEYIEEIKSQEDAKYIRQTRWIFGDMKSWPDIFSFTDEQRALWNKHLADVQQRLEEVA